MMECFQCLCFDVVAVNSVQTAAADRCDGSEVTVNGNSPESGADHLRLVPTGEAVMKP